MNYKEEFIELMLKADVLKFGEFTLKSGRKAPYFINTGNYKKGSEILKLGKFYAKCYNENFGNKEALLFGPAYKGIPLVVTTAASLSDMYDLDLNYSFNRKEAKDHGEGGVYVGTKPSSSDHVIIIEDVITAGTAVRESMDMFSKIDGISVDGLIIAVDRMEKGKTEKSTMQELRDEFGMEIHAIVTIDDIVDYLYNKEVNGKIYIDDVMKKSIDEYQSKYCS